MLGINYKEWVINSFTEADRQHRERHRKKVVSETVHEDDDVAGENDDVAGVNDDVADENDEVAEHRNNQSSPPSSMPTSPNVNEEWVEGNEDISGLLRDHSNKHMSQFKESLNKQFELLIKIYR